MVLLCKQFPKRAVGNIGILYMLTMHIKENPTAKGIEPGK